MSVSLETLFIVPFAIYSLRSIHPQPSKLSLTVVLGLLHFLANYWEGLVTKIVPEPYLDEVFHIPQAQAYCDHKYDVWDPKITTPPGLYVVASLKDFLLQGLGTKSTSCSVHALRSLNCLLLTLALIFAYACRIEITRFWNRAREPARDALHTAFNIALFPPLFFFSGLFYSDVLSTCSILVGYKLYLTRRGSCNEFKLFNQLWIYIFGIISLTIRQTNIFWFLGLLGALELPQLFPPKKGSNQVTWAQDKWQQVVWTRLEKAADGEIYDVGVDKARIQDFLLCAITIAIAAFSRPYNVIINLWPYIALLLSFTSFVYWNGGVVLGDKMNHVATINLPQMLYIWPLIVFFSAPLSFSIAFNNLLTWRNSASNLDASFLLTPKRLCRVAIYAATALAACLMAIGYNTIVHPFTLADNRHYMFYVFRYTILRGPFTRFYLGPVYVVCSYLVYLVYTPSSGVSSSKPKYNKTHESDSCKISSDLKAHHGPTTSFVLILLVSTSFSLVCTSLVEPRYFITPWVVWRLNVPSLSPKITLPHGDRAASTPTMRLTRTSLSYWIAKSKDYILWLETLWFLLINLATCYIFLYCGFEWPQEPGKVQRFMW